MSSISITNNHSRRRFGGLALGVLVALAMLCLPGVAGAATINVTTTTDEFDSGSRCSLREAIWSANNDSTAMAQGCSAGAGADVVVVPAGTFGLTREAVAPDTTAEDAGVYGDLDVTGPLSIVHRGVRPARIVAYAISERVFHALTPGGLTLDGVTIDGGDGVTRGGGILNEGFLTVQNTTIRDNYATFGGGISTEGASTAILRNVTIANNRAMEDGGGISVEAGGSVALSNVTVAYNYADYDGSGGGDGGGLFASTSGDGGTLTMRNTLVAGNSDNGNEAVDCARLGGTITSQGRNLVGNANGCDYEAGPRDILNQDARLTSLRDNGGPTATVALRKGSPAVNAGAGCTITDQRGVKRRLGGKCDIGAYELASCEGRVINRVGTEGADLLIGTSGVDGFLALGGKDTMRGAGGKDGLCGGNGKDRLEGGAGADSLNGGAGRDTCIGGSGRDSGRRCELPGRGK